MKLHKVKKRTAACDELSRVEPQNIECRMSKDGIASGFAFGYDPTGRSLFLLKKTVRHRSSRRAEYINSMFDVGRSMFISFFLIKLATRGQGGTDT